MHRLLGEPLVRAALLEDLGLAGDITTDAIISPESVSEAAFVAREAGCIAGLETALLAFSLLDPEAEFEIALGSGMMVQPGETIAVVRGRTRAILTAERTALNILGRLCGVASLTRKFVNAVRGTDVHIVCTRKTTPGLRALEKEAVRHGGGYNHRFGLDDAVLLKDNHILAAGGITGAVRRLRSTVGHLVKIEVEIDTFAQLHEALDLGVDLLLLDNMDTEELSAAVALTAGRARLEASGSMRLDRVAEVAATGIDLISVGALTHSYQTLDIGLDFIR